MFMKMKLYWHHNTAQMSNSSGSGSNGSCFDIYKDNYYIGVAVLSVVLSIISCICLLAVIAIIVLFKKYVYFNQKLILYLCIASVFFSFSTVINVTPADVDTNPASKGYCIVMGFVNHLLLWWQILCVAVIMIDIFICVVFERDTQKYIIPYIIGILAPPIVVSWIPFIKLAYGPAGVLCWIRDSEYKDLDCMPFDFGTYLRFSFFYVPFYFVTISLSVLLLITLYVARRKKRQWIGARNLGKEKIDTQKKIMSEICPLVGYPIAFIVVSVVPLILRIYEIFEPDDNDIFFYTLYVLLIILRRLLGVIIALIFALDPETRKKLKSTEIRAAAQRWYGREKNAVVTYELEVGHSDSFAAEIILSDYQQHDNN